MDLFLMYLKIDLLNTILFFICLSGIVAGFWIIIDFIPWCGVGEDSVEEE